MLSLPKLFYVVEIQNQQEKNESKPLLLVCLFLSFRIATDSRRKVLIVKQFFQKFR